MPKLSAFAVIAVIILLVVSGIILARRGGKAVTATVTEQNSPAEQLSPAPPAPKSSASPSATISQQETAQVNFTDAGFSPKNLTIKVGTTVKFINQSSSPMWPASNPHPIHTDYAGFDAKQTLDKDRNYIFTFSKKGTWGYHNHLDPSVSGTITVQ